MVLNTDPNCVRVMPPKMNNLNTVSLPSVGKWLGLRNEIKWSSSLLVIHYHIVGTWWCLHYAFPVKWPTVLFAFVTFVLAGMGITCGVHRLFTHRSYKAKTPLKVFLIWCFMLSGQNSIYNWVRDHRLHHKYSDTEVDPHNANRGLFFSHIGWLMTKKNEQVLKYGKKLDMSDILSDKHIMFQEKYFKILKLLNCFILPTVLNVWLLGESWRCAVAWQCVIRYLSVLHSELTVNSLAHAIGYKPYNKNIVPVENWFVSIVTFGEGWHNYHHVFPFDFKAAEQFDLLDWSTFFIKFWNRRGWAYDLKEATPEMINSAVNRLGGIRE